MTSTASAAPASVVVTYSGWNTSSAQAEVAAYVEGIDTRQGRCVLTMTRNGRTATAGRPAIQDAKSVQCGTLSIAGSVLTPGTWTAVVSYQSADRSGRSDPVSVEVPQ